MCLNQYDETDWLAALNTSYNQFSKKIFSHSLPESWVFDIRGCW